MNTKFLIYISLFVSKTHGEVVEITPENWDETVVNSGKSVFIKFFAPWCGHCKNLKPDWDLLGDTGSKNVIIGDVDCTEAGKPLCEKHGVKGYPTLKRFWKKTSEDYSGERSYEALKKYIDALKPLCSPETLDYCTEEQKEKISVIGKMTMKQMESKLKLLKKEIEDAETDHQELLKSLQGKFKESSEKLDILKKEKNNEITIIEEYLPENDEEKKDEL